MCGVFFLSLTISSSHITAALLLSLSPPRELSPQSLPVSHVIGGAVEVEMVEQQWYLQGNQKGGKEIKKRGRSEGLKESEHLA